MTQHEVEEHPLLVWTRIAPGDVVSLLTPKTGEYIGEVEAKTIDGLIIWVRDHLNERRLFHFRDCQQVKLLNK